MATAGRQIPVDGASTAHVRECTQVFAGDGDVLLQLARVLRMLAVGALATWHW
jgi:hypothetical protein